MLPQTQLHQPTAQETFKRALELRLKLNQQGEPNILRSTQPANHSEGLSTGQLKLANIDLRGIQENK